MPRMLVVAEQWLSVHRTHNTCFSITELSLFCLNSRKLGTAGQKLGGSAVLCHIKHDPMDPGGCFTLTSANVGKCQTVLCRNGKPLPLSRCYMMSCEEELKRIKQHKAIITEVRNCFNLQLLWRVFCTAVHETTTLLLVSNKREC